MFKKPISKPLKIIPHVNDTLLLVTGISLSFIAGYNPLNEIWLGSKIISLFFYIGFGVMALKSTGVKSITGYVFATTVFIFMIFTAIAKNLSFIGQ